MARSDQIKALLTSHSEGDEQRFRSTASEIIEDARRRRHDIFADELEAILGEAPRSRKPALLATLRPLPKGRDETPLLEVRAAQTTLHDLVLTEDVLQLVLGLIDEHRARASLHAHGLRPRSSVLFAGPSGTGKSATAEAIAGELGWPIAHVQLATVVSSFLGETAKNLNQIFSFLSSGSYVLLFDEFDMLARDRGERGDHGELKRVVGALLQLIERSNNDSIIVATTNHADLLDAALWRRFDEILEFRLPSVAERLRVLKLRLGSVRSEIDFDHVAASLEGATHAEVQTVAYDAMRFMLTHYDRQVTEDHITYAQTRMKERRRISHLSQG